MRTLLSTRRGEVTGTTFGTEVRGRVKVTLTQYGLALDKESGPDLHDIAVLNFLLLRIQTFYNPEAGYYSPAQ